MIDKKINNSLKELEQNLKEVETARKQVERTVKSYEGLNSTTADYVSKLSVITTKIQELVDAIGKDYKLKVKELEKDRDTIIKAANAGTEKFSNASDEFATSLQATGKKLTYSIIINVISLIAIGVIILMISSK